MPIKYAELTVIHDKADAGLFSALYEWFGREQITTPDSTLVFLFDDGEVYDKTGVHSETQYEFTYLSSLRNHSPAFFEKKRTRTPTYFYKEPIQIDGVSRLDFTQLFSKSATTKHVPSRYNCVYNALSCRLMSGRVDFNPQTSIYGKTGRLMPLGINPPVQTLRHIGDDENQHQYRGISSRRDIFGILRLQSNEYAPRFSIAYESNEFTKEEVMDITWKLFLGDS
jgi:hypothetical protein